MRRNKIKMADSRPDKRKTYIMVLDVETANEVDEALVYDLGWLVADKHGNIVERVSFAIWEIFEKEPKLMNTAYYAEKLPIYHSEIKSGQRKVVPILAARNRLHQSLEKYNIKEVFAYNAYFDKSALNRTLRYITKSQYRWFMPYGIRFSCIWNMACQTIFSRPTYRRMAKKQGWYSPSGKYYSTNAETAYRFLTGKYDFTELHIGWADILIEYYILLKTFRSKKKMDRNINRFCWQSAKV